MYCHVRQMFCGAWKECGMVRGLLRRWRLRLLPGRLWVNGNEYAYFVDESDQTITIPLSGPPEDVARCAAEAATLACRAEARLVPLLRDAVE